MTVSLTKHPIHSLTYYMPWHLILGHWDVLTI